MEARWLVKDQRGEEALPSKEIENIVLSRDKGATRKGGLNGEEGGRAGSRRECRKGQQKPMPFRKLGKAPRKMFPKIYIYMKGIFKESAYKGGDDAPTRRHMLPNKTVSTRNELYLFESLPKGNL